MDNWKLSIRFFLGKYPILFYPIFQILKPQNRQYFTNKQTSLVIEGYPRSANSFVVSTFQKMQQSSLMIAHHRHVPAQVIQASRLKIPCLVLIREPKDAILSYCIFEEKISIKQAIDFYIAFYSAIEPYKNSFVAASFDEVINDLSTVIKKVNSNFNTNYSTKVLPEREKEKVFEELFIARQGNIKKIPVPSKEREQLKIKIAQKLDSTVYRSRMNIANELYHKFLNFR